MIQGVLIIIHNNLGVNPKHILARGDTGQHYSCKRNGYS